MTKSNLTTLCYIEKDRQYLMMHRIKKVNDINQDKWVGVGGHFEKDETPDECLCREVLEETGLFLTKYQARGMITFMSDRWPTEYMYLYTASQHLNSRANSLIATKEPWSGLIKRMCMIYPFGKETKSSFD